MAILSKSITSINIKPNEVHFWQCSFDANKVRVPHYKSLLAQDELIRAEKFKFEIDRERYVISRGILRMLLGEYLNENPQKIKFNYTTYGKPMLQNKSSLAFNISHSGNKAVFGFVSDVEIGVDVEKVKTDFNVLDIARNFFSPKEIESLENQQEELLYRAFFRCWTRKEAFIKAEGSGLSFPLDAFSVSLDNDKNAELLETSWNTTERQRWKLFSLPLGEEYIIAVAIQNKKASITYRNFDDFSLE
jgi:4'-phosphopantetheinyl transferase